MDDFWDELLDAETNRPGKPVEFIDPPAPLDGPESIIARLEKETGTKLTGKARTRAIMELREGRAFDIADVPDEPEEDDFWAGLDTSAPKAPAAPPVAPAPKKEKGFFAQRFEELGEAVNELTGGPTPEAKGPARGYISGSGTPSDPYVGTPDTYKLLLKTKGPDAWVRTPQGNITQRDTSILEDTVGVLNRAGANIRHTLENLGPSAAMAEAKEELATAKAGGKWGGSIKAPVWIPAATSIEDAREKFKAADLASAEAARRHEDRIGLIQKSAALEQSELELSEAKTAGEGIAAILGHPGAATSQASEMLATFAPATAVAVGVPELGIPAFTAQIGADTYAQGVDNFLRQKGVDPADPAAREAFWDADPQNIDDAMFARDMHTAAMAASAIAGPLASKGIAKVLGRGTPMASTVKQLAANAVVQPAIFVGATRATNELTGQPNSVAQDVASAILPLPQMAVGARAGYRARVKRDAEVSKALTDDAYTNAEQTATKNITETNREAMKEYVEKTRDEIDKKNVATIEQAKKDAWKKSESDYPTYEAERKAAEQEAAFRTIERQRTADRLATNPNVRVKKVQPVTPEEVQKEWQSQKAAEDARLERVDMGRLTERVRARQELAKSKQAAEAERKSAAAAKAQASAAARQRAAETARANKVIDEVTAANPDADPATVARLVSERLKEAPAKPVAPAVAPKATAPIVENGKVVGEGTAGPVKAAAQREAARVAAKKPDSKLTDAEIADMSEKLGLPDEALGMAADPAARKKAQENFKTQISDVVKGLVKANTRETNDVQELIRQRKITFGPNPKALGMPENGADAAYNVKEGRLYLYTDRMDTKNPVSAVMMALHEGTHAGQFNGRDGRPVLLRQIMANKYGPAHDLIMNNYGKNALATAAVDKALKAAKLKHKDLIKQGLSKEEADKIADRVAELEVVPYFVSEAAEARQGYGRLGGLVKDIQSAGRAFLRDKLGADLKVNLNDLDTASRGAAGEIARTTLTPRQEGFISNMEMIGGEKFGASFDASDYIYRGSVDGKLRYEFGDEQAQIKESAIADLKAGKTITVRDLLRHDKLYNEYPWAGDLKLSIDPSFDKGGTFGSYNGRGQGIRLRSSLLDRPEEALSTLLHEVQHYIQDLEGFVPGANASSFMPADIVNAREQAQAGVDRAIKDFDYGAAVATLPPHLEKNWRAYVKDTPNAAARDAAAKKFLESGLWDRSSDAQVRNQGKAYNRAVEKYEEANAAWQKADGEAYQTYLRDGGEMEARNTQTRMRWSEEQRKLMPPEDTMGMDPSGLTIDKAIDTRNLRSAPAKPASETRELGMAKPPKAANDDVKKPISRRIPTWVSSMFDSAQGSGAVAREIIEAAVASPSGQRMIAEGTLGKYRRALGNEATKRGVSIKELEKEITDKLEAVSRKTDGFEKNYKAFREVADQYGDAGKALVELRDQADSLSRQMLRARVEQGTPLNPDEIKTYTTIRNNLGRYAHRQYGIHLGENGRKYAQGVMADYEKAKAASDKKSLPDYVRKNYEKVANVVGKIIDDQLVIPSDEALTSLPKEQIESLFETWAGATDPRAFTMEQKRNELARIRDAVNANGPEMERTAEEVVRQILEISDTDEPSLVTKYYRGGKLDKGILKERSNIPEEIRDLMGEIKEPAMRMFVTVAKQAEFIARNRMLTELRDMNNPAHLQPPGNPGRKEVEGMVQLRGETYGPLQNHYVSKNLHNLLSDNVQQLANFEQAIAMASTHSDALAGNVAKNMLSAWGKVSGFTKMAQIIYKPVNFLYNFMGGSRTMLMNGNLNPSYFWDAAKTARDIIRYSIDPTTNSALARRATEAGITDSAFNGEIRGELLVELNKTLREMRGQDAGALMKALRKGREYAHKGKVVTNETYAMMDVVYKIANFLHQADHLKEFYKAEGIERTPNQIDREAADITNRTNITYKRAAPVVRVAEKYGVTNFGTFFYEVFRAEVNNIRQGISELRRAQTANSPAGAEIMRMQGAKRLLGQITAWGLTAAAARGLANITFGDDPEKERKLRDMLPDYMQSKDFIVVGKDEKGKPILFDISRIDPAGPASDIMRSALNGDASIDQLEEDIFRLYVAPRIGVRLAEAIGTTTGLTDKRPATPLVQQLAPESFAGVLKATNAMGVNNRNTKAWTNVAETFLPGIVSGWRKSNARPMVEDASSGMAWGMTYLGGSMYKANPEAITKDASVQYDDAIKANRTAIKELFIDEPDMDVDVLVGRLDDMRTSELEAFERLQKAHDGMEALGMTPRKISVALKDAGVSPKVIKDLKAGEFKFRTVSKKSIEQHKAKDLKKAKTPEEKKAAKEKWDNIWAMLQTSKGQLSDEETN